MTDIAPSDRVESGKRRKVATFVYFVGAMPSRLIKIGIASNMVQRLASLQTGNPERLSVIGVIRDPDPKRLEDLLHREFRADRQTGEWFKPSPKLEAFINRVARTPAQDEQDVRDAMLADWKARGIIKEVSPTVARRMSRQAKLARYKAARGIVA